MSAAKAMPEPIRFRFGPYVIDSERSTLLEGDTILSLQPKPFSLLQALVRRAGQVVTREELARILWPDTYVQIDQGLNAAMKKVRGVLRDDARSPRYIETLGSRGYRFICPVEVLGWSEPAIAREAVADMSQSIAPTSVNEVLVRARYQLSQHTRNSLSRAIALFKNVLEQDPVHSPAYAGLANAYTLMGDMHLMVPHAAYDAARTNAARGLELDPNLLDAMVPLGWSTLLLNRDWKAAHRWMERALQVNPRHAPAFTVLGRLEMMRGRRAEAVTLVRHARLLAPLSVANNVALAQFLYFAMEFEAAVSQAMQTLEMNHGAEMMVLPVLCCSLLALGRPKEAVALLSAYVENEDEMFPSLPTLATALAHEGRLLEAQRVLQRAEQEVDDKPPASYMLSFTHRALGNRRQAENWMVRAIHERSYFSLFLSVDPHAQDYVDFVGVKPWMEWLRHLAVS